MGLVWGVVFGFWVCFVDLRCWWFGYSMLLVCFCGCFIAGVWVLCLGWVGFVLFYVYVMWALMCCFDYWFEQF